MTLKTFKKWAEGAAKRGEKHYLRSALKNCEANGDTARAAIAKEYLQDPEKPKPTSDVKITSSKKKKLNTSKPEE